MSSDIAGTVTFDKWSTGIIDRIAPLYVRGTGYHQSGSRKVQLGSQLLVPVEDATTKGLGLLVLHKTTHEIAVPHVVFNTHLSTHASNALASALDAISVDQIGILTSCNRFEGNVTTALGQACQRMGLDRLARFIFGKLQENDAQSQRAYAAVFGGATGSHTVFNAIESFETNTDDAPAAVITTFLLDDGLGHRAPATRLVPPDPLSTGIGAVVDTMGRVGIGKLNPTATLDVHGTVKATQVAGPLHKSITFQDGSGTPLHTFNNTGDVTVTLDQGGSEGINADTDEMGAPEYNGHTRKEGAFYGGTVDPVGTTRLNYDGDLHASHLLGSSIGESATGLDATVETVTCLNATVGGRFLGQDVQCERLQSTEIEGSTLSVSSDANVYGNLDVMGETVVHGNVAMNGTDAFVGTLSDHTLAFRTDNVDRVRITSEGRVGIGENHTPGTPYQLDVQGTIYASGDVVLFSDERFKTDVESIHNALDLVSNMRGVRYRWKEGGDRTHVGLLAQEVERFVPEAVITDAETDKKSVSYGNLVGVLVSAINDMHDELRGIRTTCAELCERMDRWERES